MAGRGMAWHGWARWGEVRQGKVLWVTVIKWKYLNAQPVAVIKSW